jgi:TRAP-type transport system small permease protein
MKRLQAGLQALMGLCLGLMACLVFVNVVLRYGFGTGIASSEEASRLLFVWMVFLGATLAYPKGEHMAFTSLLLPLRKRPLGIKLATLLIRLAVLLACALLGWGAWQQVNVGWESRSPVMGYPLALLPLPALLCSLAIACMVLLELAQQRPMTLGHGPEAE